MCKDNTKHMQWVKYIQHENESLYISFSIAGISFSSAVLFTHTSAAFYEQFKPSSFSNNTESIFEKLVSPTAGRYKLKLI